MSDPLSVDVTPGYSFVADELITPDKLNRLGNPLVNVTGNITTSAIADGSVTIDKLPVGVLEATQKGLDRMADGYLSNDGLLNGLKKMADNYLRANAAGRAKMENGFIQSAKVDLDTLAATNLADSVRGEGFQFAGVTGTNDLVLVLTPAPLAAINVVNGFTVKFRPSAVNTGACTLKVQLRSGAGSGTAYPLVSCINAIPLIAGQLQINGIYEAVLCGGYWNIVGMMPIAQSAGTDRFRASIGTIVTFAHGLPIKPNWVKVAVLCTSNDAVLGYTALDEVDISSYAFTHVVVDAVNVTVLQDLTTYLMAPKAGGVAGTVDLTKYACLVRCGVSQ